VFMIEEKAKKSILDFISYVSALFGFASYAVVFIMGLIETILAFVVSKINKKKQDEKNASHHTDTGDNHSSHSHEDQDAHHQHIEHEMNLIKQDEHSKYSSLPKAAAAK